MVKNARATGLIRMGQAPDRGGRERMGGREIRPWRVYDRPFPEGYRVLVERLWPRGLRKTDLALDYWTKDLAPSTKLRQWFHHDPERWVEFRERYLAELQAHPEAVSALTSQFKGDTLLLLYAAHDTAHNGALVLADFLRSLPAP